MEDPDCESKRVSSSFSSGSGFSGKVETENRLDRGDEGGDSFSVSFLSDISDVFVEAFTETKDIAAIKSGESQKIGGSLNK